MSGSGPTHFWRLGMGILAPSADERVKGVEFDDASMSVSLMDGRVITVPLAWYPRLLDATPEQRRHWQPAGAGHGISAQLVGDGVLEHPVQVGERRVDDDGSDRPARNDRSRRSRRSGVIAHGGESSVSRRQQPARPRCGRCAPT